MRKVALRRQVPALLATTFLVSLSAVTVQTFAGEQTAPPMLDELCYTFDIPAKPLHEALRDFAQVTGMSIAINRSDAMMLVGIVSRPVQGQLTAGEALAALTARTGVQFRRDNFQKFTMAAPVSRAVTVLPVDRASDNVVPPLPETVREANAQGDAAQGTSAQGTNAQGPAAQQSSKTELPKINVRSNRPRRTARAAPPAPRPPAAAPIPPNPGGDVGYHAESSSAGTKTNTPLRNIPQSITVITKQQVQDIGAHRLEDVAHYVPGVNWQQGEGNRDQIVIRGVSSTADFFVDGIRDDGQVFRDIYNTERLEFLKGPNALIFGRGGSGGVLNRVLKSADGVPVNEWKVQTGSYNDARVSGDVGGKITDTLYGRLNGVFEDTDSYRNYSHAQRGGVNPTFTWLATPLTKVKFSYEYFHDYRTADRGIPSFLSGVPYGGATPSMFFGDPGLSNTSLTQNIANVYVDHDFANGLSVSSKTRYASYQHYYQNVFAGSAVTNANTYTLAAYNNSNDRQNVINQTDWTYKFYTADVKHTFVFGSELGNQQSANNRHTGLFGNSTSSGPISVFSPTVFNTAVDFRGNSNDARNRTDLNTSSGYIQDQVELTRWLQLIGGIRFDRFDLKYVNLNEQSATLGQTFARTDDLWSPRVGAVLKPVEPFSFYGSYSVSYLPASGDQFNSLTVTNTGLKPEKFTNQEVGTKWDLLPRLTWTTAFYQLDRENTAIKDSLTQQVVAQGASRALGIETGLAGYVTDKWQVSAGYANVNAHYLTDTASATNGNLAAKAGSHVQFVPVHTYSLWNRYDINYNWGVGLGIISQTEYYAAADNLVHVPGYTRVDGAVYWRLNKFVKAQINVENIFGAKYYPTADGTNNITIGSPRAAWFTLTTNFTGEDHSAPIWGPGLASMLKPASTGPAGVTGPIGTGPGGSSY